MKNKIYKTIKTFDLSRALDVLDIDGIMADLEMRNDVYTPYTVSSDEKSTYGNISELDIWLVEHGAQRGERVGIYYWW